MTDEINIHIPMKAISKDNVKIVNAYGRFYLPKKYKDFEKECKLYAKGQYKGQPLEGALSVELVCGFKNAMRSDCGNLSKSINDAMNGILWIDDRQILNLFIKVLEKEPTEYIKIRVYKITLTSNNIGVEGLNL